MYKMNESGIKWKSTPCNVLDRSHTTHVFSIWHVLACASVIACLSNAGLYYSNVCIMKRNIPAAETKVMKNLRF